MQLSCLKENLIRALGLVSRIVGTKVSLPILSNILLSTDKGRLKISATDLELGINTWIGAKIEKNGAITLPTRLFNDFIGSLPDEKITLAISDKKATISGKTTCSVIKGLEATDFPLIPEIKKPTSVISIDSQKLKEALGKTVFSCAIDETKPVLSGVLFKIKKDKIILVATDSFRLSEQTIVIKKNENECEFIIPKRTANELTRIIAEQSEELKIKISENQASFEFGNTFFITRLIEGSFPDYTQIIPKTQKTTLTIDKEEFSRGLKVASLFSKDAANNVAIEADQQKIQISATSQQLGESHSEAKCLEMKGEKVKFSVNAMFLLECLNNISEPEIQLKLVDKNSPIQLISPKNKNSFFLIMPLRQE